MVFDLPNFGELVDKGKEALGNTTEKISANLEEFRDWSKYTIANQDDAGNRLAKKYSQETEIDENHAETIADLAERTWNPETITAYLQNKTGSVLDWDTSQRMLALGDECCFGDSSNYPQKSITEQESVIDFYTQLAEKGAITDTANSKEDLIDLRDDKYLAQYKNDLRNGKWEKQAPAYLAILTPEQQGKAYDLNPIAFARTFPSSELVKGDILMQIVKEEIAQISKANSIQAINGGQVGRTPERTLLANPNLTPEQRKTICAAITTVKGERNTASGQEAIHRIVQNVVSNRTNPNDFVAIVEKFYGPDIERGYMSEETHAAIVTRAANIKDKIGEENYQMLLETKRFTPSGKGAAVKTKVS